MQRQKTTLSLRALDIKADLPHIMQWVNDKEVTFYFASLSSTITLNQERQYLLKALRSDTDRIYSIYGQNNTYVGQVSINKIDWIAKTGRLFVLIKKQRQGKGLAMQAIREAQRKAFTELKLNKLWLITRCDNEKARHLYRRCGFETEGILREEYLVNGTYYDMARMYMLAREFNLWWRE